MKGSLTLRLIQFTNWISLLLSLNREEREMVTIFITAQHQLIPVPPHVKGLPHLRRKLDGLQQGAITGVQHQYSVAVTISNQQNVVLLGEQQAKGTNFLPSHFTLHFPEPWPCVTGHCIHCTNSAEGHSIVWVRQITQNPVLVCSNLYCSTCFCEAFSDSVQLMTYCFSMLLDPEFLFISRENCRGGGPVTALESYTYLPTLGIKMPWSPSRCLSIYDKTQLSSLFHQLSFPKWRDSVNMALSAIFLSVSHQPGWKYARLSFHSHLPCQERPFGHCVEELYSCQCCSPAGVLTEASISIPPEKIKLQKQWMGQDASLEKFDWSLPARRKMTLTGCWHDIVAWCHLRCAQ